MLVLYNENHANKLSFFKNTYELWQTNNELDRTELKIIFKGNGNSKIFEVKIKNKILKQKDEPEPKNYVKPKRFQFIRQTDCGQK